MKIISHRGNKNGPNPKLENNPDYIVAAINSGFDVEVDVRVTEGELYLGHDFSQFKITLDFLIENSYHLWIHCKNIESAAVLRMHSELNIFCHKEDDFTMSSFGYVLTPPNTYPHKRCITMMPELSRWPIETAKIAGIITDYPIKYSLQCK